MHTCRAPGVTAERDDAGWMSTSAGHVSAGRSGTVTSAVASPTGAEIINERDTRRGALGGISSEG